MPLTADDTKVVIEEVNKTLLAFQDTTNKAIEVKLAEGLGKSDTSVAALTAQLEDIKKSLAANQQQLALIGRGVPGLDDEIARGKVKFSVSNVVRALYKEKTGVSREKAWEGAEREKEIVFSDAMIAKSSNFSTSQEAGGVLIPQAILDLVGLVYPAIPLLDKLPIMKLEGLVGDIRIPRLLSGTTAYQVGENTAPTATAAKYSEYVMRPRRSAALTFQSKTLIMQSGGASDTAIRENLAMALTVQIHKMLLNGTGNDYQPLGLNGWVGTTAATQIADSGLTLENDLKVSTNGGRFTITDARLMKSVLKVKNEGDAPAGNYGYLMYPTVLDGMMTERVLGSSTAKGIPIVPTTLYLTDDQLKAAGLLCADSSQITATETKAGSSTLSKVFYGNWKMFYVGFWADMAIRVSDQAYDSGISAFSQNGMFIIAEQAIDCCVARPTAFCYTSGAETNPANWIKTL